MKRALLLLVYNLLLPLGLLLLLPGFFSKMGRRGGYSGRFGDRFGCYPETVLSAVRGGRVIWMHAVSVGEVNVARKVAVQLRRREPETAVVLSTTTATGFQVASQEPAVVAIYSPVDLPGVAARCLKALQPTQLVFVEGELWPNWLEAARRRGIPCCLINARLSPRSEARFRKFQAVVRPLYAQLAWVGVQFPAEVALWKQLGPSSVWVSGSVKYDWSENALPEEGKRREIASWLERVFPDRAGAPVVLFSSSSPGEEQLLAEAVDLLPSDCSVRLVLVPRHMERREEVRADLQTLGWEAVLKSREQSPSQGKRALVVDTTGELGAWTAFADLVVIGKSFLGRGGQNPVEAMAAEKAVLTGPFMENFRDLMEALVAEGGVTVLREVRAGSLAQELAALLGDPERCQRQGARAKKALAPHVGATARTADWILEREEILLAQNGPADSFSAP
ncbi:MAG: glycosyltransferase N-terminal domain-containing protein [Verrucomicrobiota bacterium]